jgi:myosin heavy subunit
LDNILIGDESARTTIVTHDNNRTRRILKKKGFITIATQKKPSRSISVKQGSKAPDWKESQIAWAMLALEKWGRRRDRTVNSIELYRSIQPNNTGEKHWETIRKKGMDKAMKWIETPRGMMGASTDENVKQLEAAGLNPKTAREIVYSSSLKLFTQYVKDSKQKKKKNRKAKITMKWKKQEQRKREKQEDKEKTAKEKRKAKKQENDKIKEIKRVMRLTNKNLKEHLIRLNKKKIEVRQNKKRKATEENDKNEDKTKKKEKREQEQELKRKKEKKERKENNKRIKEKREKDMEDSKEKILRDRREQRDQRAREEGCRRGNRTKRPKKWRD